MSPASSARSTTASAWSASRRACACGRSRSSTAGAAASCRGSSAASTGSPRSATAATGAAKFEVANMSISFGVGPIAQQRVRRWRDAIHQAHLPLSGEARHTWSPPATTARNARRNRPAAYDEVITVSAMADYDGRGGGRGKPRFVSLRAPSATTHSPILELRPRRRPDRARAVRALDIPEQALCLHERHLDGLAARHGRGRDLPGDVSERQAAPGQARAHRGRQARLANHHRSRPRPRARRLGGRLPPAPDFTISTANMVSSAPAAR